MCIFTWYRNVDHSRNVDVVNDYSSSDVSKFARFIVRLAVVPVFFYVQVFFGDTFYVLPIGVTRHCSVFYILCVVGINVSRATSASDNGIRLVDQDCVSIEFSRSKAQGS